MAVTLDVRHAIGVDLETKPIERLPAPPPAPVGVAIQWPGKKARYFAFGHESENNATREQARAALRDVYRSARPILGHNFLHFDAAVIEHHFGLPQISHDQIIDTQAWTFLAAPNEPDLGLKPLAAKWLSEPPTERDAVREWIFEHIPGARRARTKWAQHIWRAPGSLVGAYAIGDVTRPRRLAEHLLPQIAPLREALDMEQWWLQYATRMERRGVPIATRRLGRDVKLWTASLEKAERWIRRRIKSPNAPLVGEALADALEKANLVNQWDDDGSPAWNLTPKKGRRSTKHADLRLTCSDPEVTAALRYHGLLSVYKATFAEEWLRQARETGGECHFAWNTVRHAKDEDAGGSSSRAIGARTGRMSSTPNAQNLPKRPREICFSVRQAERIRKEGSEVIHLPSALRGAAPLPNMRDYIVPPKGHVVLDRDFMGQELRIFSHRTARFGGVARDAYLREPRMDFHRWVTNLVNSRLGTTFARGAIKNVVFAVLYGAGLVKLAAMLSTGTDEAKMVRDAVREALPELLAAERWYKGLEARGEAFFTIGGRRYTTEERTFVERADGEFEERSFAYKNLNTDIQGSAADQTKRAGRIMVEEFEIHPTLITHDQLTHFSPAKQATRRMAKMRRAMEEGTQALLSVPVVSDGQWSRRSWGALEPFTEAA